MATITSLCVYCGSREGRDAAHVETARRLGAALAMRGITLVYGGGGIGLMAVLADAVLAGGGKVVGVIPEHLARIEVLHPGLTETVVTDGMHIRKRTMFDRADAFAVLPGGFGTLDEFFELLTWKQIGLHDKPVAVLDDGGYWAPLRSLLDHVVTRGFASRDARGLVTVVRTVDALFHAFEHAPAPSSRLQGALSRAGRP